MKKIVLLVLLVAVALLTGCSSSTPSGVVGNVPAKEDSGVAQCKKIAATFAQPRKTKTTTPSKADIAASRKDFQASEIDSIQAAGTNYADFYSALFYGTGEGQVDMLGFFQKLEMLKLACADAGVVFPDTSLEPGRQVTSSP